VAAATRPDRTRGSCRRARPWRRECRTTVPSGRRARCPAPTRARTAARRDGPPRPPSWRDLLQHDVGNAELLAGYDLDPELVGPEAISHDAQPVRPGGDRHVGPRRVSDELAVHV